MTREAINLTISESLRRAQVRQRLDALAQITGLAQAQLAGRALTIGLGHIEANLTLIFPGVAVPSLDGPGLPMSSAAPPGTVGLNDAQQGAAAPRMAAAAPSPTSPPESAPAPMPSDAPAAALSLAEPPAPAPTRTERLCTQDAARALGYSGKDAFAQHVHRHSELKRCGRKSGNVWTWDLGKLRAEYARRGWSPK